MYNGTNKFLDSYTKASKEPEIPKTFADERAEAEFKAVEANKKLLANKNKFKSLTASTENHPGTKSEFNDEHVVENKATKALDEVLASYKLKGGSDITIDEFRSIKSHNDRINDNKITDEALVAFAAKFSTPSNKGYKTAKFIVSFKDNVYTVADRFYDEQDNEHELNQVNIDKFFTTKDNSEMNKVASIKPIVFFDGSFGDVGRYEIAETVEDTKKVIARLKTAGFDRIDSNFWVDRCNGPEFGKVCYFVEVPNERIGEFKKTSVMSDEEWVNRGTDKSGKGTPSTKPDEWVDRALDPTNKQIHYTKDNWTDRACDVNKDANPYSTEAKALYAGASKKEEVKTETVKKAIASDNSNINDTLSQLENLLK